MRTVINIGIKGALLVLLCNCTLVSKRDGYADLDANMALALARIDQVAAALESGSGSEMLGTVPGGRCPAGVDSLLCSMNSDLSSAQREYLTQFVMSALPGLRTFAQEKPSRLELNMDAGFMSGVRGVRPSRTARGPHGAIYLFAPELRSYSVPRLMALIVHEMLYKSPSLLSDWLDDNSSYGPFASGTELGAHAGSALAVLSSTLFPMETGCPEILASQPTDRVFYAAHAPSHQTGKLGECGRSWVGSAPDAAGRFTYGRSLKLRTGLHFANFYLKIDSIALDDGVIAELRVQGDGRTLSYVPIRRSDFTRANTYQSFVVPVDFPLAAVVDFTVDWKRNSRLEYLGVKLEGVAGSRTFTADWDYPRLIAAAVRPSTTIAGALEADSLAFNAGTTYVKFGLNLTDLPAVRQDVYYTLTGTPDNVPTSTPLIALEIWEHVVLPDYAGEYDVARVAMREISGIELSRGGASELKVFKLSFVPEANKMYDLRVRLLGAISAHSQVSVAVVNSGTLGAPIAGPFKFDGRYYQGNPAQGSFCRYLTFDELRLLNPSVQEASAMPEVAELPAMVGGGLCRLIPQTTTFFKAYGSTILGADGLYSPFYQHARRAYRSLNTSGEFSSCNSVFDLVPYGLTNFPPRDPRAEQDIPAIQFFPMRVKGQVEKPGVYCTGEPVPEPPPAERCATIEPPTGTPSASATLPSKVCSADPGVNLIHVQSASPPALAEFPHCTLLRHFNESSGSYLCSNVDMGASWQLNLPDFMASWMPPQVALAVQPLDLPEQKHCVEFVDPRIALTSRSEARAYLCTTQDYQLSFSLDGTELWHRSFFTY
ncbi:MAG: hypothetical protein R3B54_13625 [Bdellovibrionota bacterium]